MNSVDLRKTRKTFWESKQHTITTPASLIVNSADDPTTMFNTAGMQPLVPYLMGKPHPTGSDMVYNIQGCVRTVDIDEVGDTSHLTYFEMMGNWSLGSYFKKESISWSREFLTDVLKLDTQMLCVTIFEGDADAPFDEESKQLRLEQGLPEHRITPMGKDDNRRGPAGATGPCGPDSEIFYRVGPGKPPADSSPLTDDDNRLEIRNNVFMGYYKDDKGAVSEMETKNVDTGMGFERILLVHAGQEMKKNGKIDALSSLSVYDIDMFQGFFDTLSTYAFQSYQETSETVSDLNTAVLPSYRIVADHIRSSLMLIHEGLVPSNEGRGYVLRRIIRRGYYHLKKLCGEQNDFSKATILHAVVTSLSKSFDKHYEHIGGFDGPAKILADEMTQFESALQRGGNKIDDILSKHEGTIFSGADAFLLYDTFGVPVELTQEIVATQGLSVDMAGYEAALETAKEVSRAGAGDKFAKGINRADHIQGLPETKFVGYEQLECSESKILKDFAVAGSRYLVFDCSPFYAESGGQKGDTGTIELDDGEVIKVIGVQKYGGVWLHKVG